MIPLFEIERSLLFADHTDEWWSIRCGKITCSGFGKAMAQGRGGEEFGETAKKYAYQIAYERHTGKQFEGYHNAAMERGTQLQSVAALLFQQRTGLQITECGYIAYDDQIGGTPDGLILSEDASVQIKCHENPILHIETLMTDKKSVQYSRQCAGEMLIADASKCYYIVYHPDFKEPSDLYWTVIERDLAYEEKMITRLNKFKDIIVEITNRLSKKDENGS